MASETNYQGRGERVTIAGSKLTGPHASPNIKGGDPVLVGRLCGVAVADQTPGTAGPYNDANVVVQLVGIFNLSVSSQQEAGIVIGETVYMNTSTGALSDDYTQTPFGIALGAVTLGSSATIPVRLFGATFGVIGAGS